MADSHSLALALPYFRILLVCGAGALLPDLAVAGDTGSPPDAAAAAIQLTVLPSSVSFGEQKAGLFGQPRTITVTTVPGTTATFTFAIAGTDAGDFMQASTLEDLSSGLVYAVVAFLPRLAGPKSASLTITAKSATGSSQTTVPLTGTGVVTGAFEIVNGLTGKVLDVVGGSTANGAGMDQNALAGVSRQQWNLVQTSGGYYRIVNAVTQKALEVPDNSTANGTPIEQWTSHSVSLAWVASVSQGVVGYNVYRGATAGGPYTRLNSALVGTTSYVDVTVQSGEIYYYVTTAVNGSGEESGKSAEAHATTPVTGADQEWQLVAVDGVHYKIVSRLSGKVLDVTAGSGLDGALVQQWKYLANPQQLWVLIPVRRYQILNAWSGKTLEVAGASLENGALVQQWSVNGNKQQQWQLIPVGGGYYSVLNYLTGKVLDVTGLSASNGALIQQWRYLQGLNQQWKLVPLTVTDSRGSFVPNALNFKFVNRLSGKVLDDTGLSLSNGAIMQQWTSLGGANQQWRFVSVPN